MADDDKAIVMSLDKNAFVFHFSEITCQVESPEHGRAVKRTLHANKNVELVGGEGVGYTHADSQLNKNEKIDLQYGETVHFTCDEGYKLYGTDSVTCTQQGYLKVPMCIPVEPDCQVIGKQFVCIQTFNIY